MPNQASPQAPRARGGSHSQGYIHCMPYGNVSFVIRLSPLHPGYVMTVCASTSPNNAIAATTVDITDLNISYVCTRGSCSSLPFLLLIAFQTLYAVLALLSLSCADNAETPNCSFLLFIECDTIPAQSRE